MINTDPFRKLLSERGLTVNQLAQITGLPQCDLSNFSRGKRITANNIETLCKVLQCQPCDLIEFTKTENKGHWEWIAEKTE